MIMFWRRETLEGSSKCSEAIKWRNKLQKHNGQECVTFIYMFHVLITEIHFIFSSILRKGCTAQSKLVAVLYVLFSSHETNHWLRLKCGSGSGKEKNREEKNCNNSMRSVLPQCPCAEMATSAQNQTSANILVTKENLSPTLVNENKNRSVFLLLH